MVIATWLLAAAGVAVGILCDMRWLKVNRIGISKAAWMVASTSFGPVAGMAYLILRRAIWRTLLEAVWHIVGETSERPRVRRARLLALRRSGLIGEPVFRACLRMLEATAAPSQFD